VAGFGISGVEPSGSATRELISKLNLREIDCEDGKWMELAQDRVQWQALVLAVLNIHQTACWPSVPSSQILSQQCR